ncbi:LOW QUALITY PROTEIN: extracellular calcium-sensing receptor-like [Leptodactylus fuscus]|uniref:LOW QUALITY PROTEIN: extracellular calcium-sensing receptor-like n=1 Tax=Leptodactylus fuscus TaxID=238119 RepID=UPI003F4EDE65
MRSGDKCPITGSPIAESSKDKEDGGLKATYSLHVNGMPVCMYPNDQKNGAMMFLSEDLISPRPEMFFYKILWSLIQYYLATASHPNGHGCILDASDEMGIVWSGDIMVGAVLSLHVNKVNDKITYKEKPGPVICKRYQLDKYLQLQTIRYAMKEINNNPNLLPNITLGFQIYDSCRVLQKELEGTLWMITGQNRGIPNYQCQKRNRLAAFIGYTTSTFSILMAHILSLFRYPQISHVSTSSLLSDRTQFPSFFRTAPSDCFQSKGLAQLLLHFRWTWVGMIADSNDYGYQGIQGVRQEFIKSGACVEFLEYVQNNRPDRNFPRIIQTIQKSRAKTVVIFATDVDIILMFEEFLRLNITGKLWVASEGWATSNSLSSDRYSQLLAGTLGFDYSREPIPGFQDYIENFNYSKVLVEPWDGMFWEGTIGCAFLDFTNVTFNREGPNRNCTVDERLQKYQISVNNITNLGMLTNLYNAIHVIAKTMHDLSLCRVGEGAFKVFFSNLHVNSSLLVDFIGPWPLPAQQLMGPIFLPILAAAHILLCFSFCRRIGEVLHYIKKVQVTLSNGRDLYFDKNGDSPPIYDIVNWQINPKGSMKQVKVGTINFTSTYRGTLNINTISIHWPFGDQKVPMSICSESCPPGSGKASIPGEPSCCYKCVPCSQGAISNETDATECYECPWNEWPSEENDRCLQKPMEYLSYEETLGVTLASTSVSSSFVPITILGLLICYKNTPIVRANNYTISCLLLICLSLCFLCSLAFIGYPEHQKCLLRQVAFGMVFALCVSCILAKTILVMIAFRATKPNSDLRRWASPQVSYLVICMGTFIQFLICTIWLIISPPFPEFNAKAKTGVIVVECNEGSSNAFWFILGYLSLLAVISFLAAFLARKLPDRFNEAKFITFSMLAFLTVWMSFIPASLSTSGKYTVAMEIFAIMSSSWALICCLFFPKCYIILLKPHVNSRKRFLGNMLC